MDPAQTARVALLTLYFAFVVVFTVILLVPDVFYREYPEFRDYEAYKRSLRERYLRPLWEKRRDWLVGAWIASVGICVIYFAFGHPTTSNFWLIVLPLFYAFLPLAVFAVGFVAIFVLYGFRAVVDAAINAKAEGRNPYLAAFGLLVLIIVIVVLWWILEGRKNIDGD